jgi:hypothetical protein
LLPSPRRLPSRREKPTHFASCFLDVRVEAGEFFSSQHVEAHHGDQALKAGRATHVVECGRHRVVSLMQQLEELQVSLMGREPAVPGDCNCVIECLTTESFKSDFMNGS